MNKQLTEADLTLASKRLNVSLATIKAVAEVESAGHGFLLDGRVIMRFEPHVFHRYTKGKYAAKHPDLSYENWNPADRITTEIAWERFQRACKLDTNAAVMSTSWGMFQIMGFNFGACGFTHLGKFVKAMEESEGNQLDLFCTYIINSGLDDELRNRQWAIFARKYNGTQYQRNQYDTKLANAFHKYSIH